MIIGDDPKKFFQVGSQVTTREKEGLIEFLRKRVDVFAWDAYDAPEIDPNFICHHLNVDPSATPKKQPPRRPFSMTYEVEAVIPIETSFLTLRTSTFTLSNNEELLGKSLDLIKEKREKTMIQLAYYHQKLKQGYNAM